MHCTKHSHETAVASCRRCALDWCATCVVYTYGIEKPPYCLSCALVAAGVRTHGTHGALPAATRRQLSAKRKAAKRAAREAARAAKAGAVTIAATATAGDWNTPWWEAAERDMAKVDVDRRTPVD
jgi:hypothetical protein